MSRESSRERVVRVGEEAGGCGPAGGGGQGTTVVGAKETGDGGCERDGEGGSRSPWWREGDGDRQGGQRLRSGRWWQAKGVGN